MAKGIIQKVTNDGVLYLTRNGDKKELKARLFDKSNNIKPFLFTIPVTETQAGFFVPTYSDNVFITVEDLMYLNMFNLK